MSVLSSYYITFKTVFYRFFSSLIMRVRFLHAMIPQTTLVVFGSIVRLADTVMPTITLLLKSARRQKPILVKVRIVSLEYRTHFVHNAIQRQHNTIIASIAPIHFLLDDVGDSRIILAGHFLLLTTLCVV